MRHVRNTRWTSDTHDRAVASDNKTSMRCDDNNEDKNYHHHFNKKMKAGCVVVVPFARLTIDSQVESKEQKERDISFILDNEL
jgi:hypothetical protein